MNARQEQFHKLLVERIVPVLRNFLGREPTDNEVLIAIAQGVSKMGWVK